VVIVGMAEEPFIGYRLSSSAFPNRKMVVDRESVHVVSCKGFEEENSKNPYLIYKCLQKVGSRVIVANGTHIEEIFSLVQNNQHPVKAIEKVLKELGPEQDEHLTPRIVGILAGTTGYLGVATPRGIEIEKIELKPKSFKLVATNHFDYLSGALFEIWGRNENEIARFLLEGPLFKTMSHPISACAFMDGKIGVWL
jgi:IMP cyclohydrolase